MTKSAAVMSYGDLNEGNAMRGVDHGDECDGSPKQDLLLFAIPCIALV
jgi:hypothetical protein